MISPSARISLLNESRLGTQAIECQSFIRTNSNENMNIPQTHKVASRNYLPDVTYVIRLDALPPLIYREPAVVGCRCRVTIPPSSFPLMASDADSFDPVHVLGKPLQLFCRSLFSNDTHLINRRAFNSNPSYVSDVVCEGTWMNA